MNFIDKYGDSRPDLDLLHWLEATGEFIPAWNAFCDRIRNNHLRRGWSCLAQGGPGHYSAQRKQHQHSAPLADHRRRLAHVKSLGRGVGEAAAYRRFPLSQGSVVHVSDV